MVPPHSSPGSHLVLGSPTSSISQFFPAIHSLTGKLHSRFEDCWGYRGDQVPSLPGSPFHSTKEGDNKTTGHPGPVGSQQEHLVSIFQDDYYPGCYACTTKRCLCHLNRLERCLLAHSDKALLSEVPRLQNRRSEIPIQGNAFRTEYCTESFYQTMPDDIETASSTRNPSPGLLGRLVDLGKLGRTVSVGNPESDTSPDEEGLPSKYGKIPSRTSSEIPVAGDIMGYGQDHPVIAQGQSGVSISRPFCLFETEDFNQAAIREHVRQTSVCGHSRPGRKSSFESRQPVSERSGQTRSTRQSSSLSKGSKKVFDEMEEQEDPALIHSLPSTSSINRCLHRRLPSGVGGPLIRRTRLEGVVVSNITSLPHKCTGNGGSILGLEEVASTSGQPRQSSLRQHDGSELHKPSRVSKVKSTELMGTVHPDIIAKEEIGNLPLSCGGSVQSNSGHPLKTRPKSLGVVSRQRFLQLDMSQHCPATSGPLCDKEQHQTSSICFSSTGFRRSGGECLVPRLESVGDCVSVSSHQSSFEGFEPSAVIPGQSNPDHPELAQSGVVSGSGGQNERVLSDSQSETLPRDWARNLLCRIKTSERVTLLDVMMSYYSTVYSASSAEILVKSIRKSTTRQYESVWGTFCAFIKSKDPQVMDCEFILSFFRFLFSERKLSPATISAYKAALARPLKYIFKIDVSVSPFQDFMKGLFNIRPVRPYKNPNWSLDKVLSLALSSRFQDDPVLEDRLMLTLFLVALATGNRISELQALLRSSDYVDFCEGGVRLFTNPNFLAKNELPSARREPIFINSLFNSDGSVHPLCPVRALRNYLFVTESSDSLKIFVHPSTLQELTIFKIRYFICKFIRIADPTSFPKSHDLRKIASSFAFFRGMGIDEICSVVGWASFRVFKKHYLKQIQGVKSAVVVLGNKAAASVRNTDM